MKIVYFIQVCIAGGIERVLNVKLNYLADVLKYDIVLLIIDKESAKISLH